MTRTRFLVPSLATLLAVVVSPAAHALSCDEIMNMVEVNVPENIVVATIKDSGDQFSSDEVGCLEDRGAPAAVVSQAKSQMLAEAPAVGPAAGDLSTEEEAPAAAPSELDADEDVLGARSAREPADLPERGAAGADPNKIKEAIKLYKAKKPLTSSLMLYEMIDAGQFPEHETKMNYYLGRSLQDLEMYHAAQYHFMQVIRKGPENQYFAYALPQLVKIARFTGDDTELMRIVGKIPPDAYPRGAKRELFYLMGTRFYAKDELSKANKYFAQVSPKSPLFLKAEYYRGVIFNEQGKLKSAVRSFRNVYKEEVDFYNDAGTLAEIEEIKSLALLNVARVYYGIQRYDEANKYYSLVDRNSVHWPEALFEHAWSNFMQNNLNDTLGQLMTIRSGFFNEDDFNPEATVLRALTYFNLCEYKKVEKLLLTFENSYRPMQSEMRDFIEQYASSEGRKLSDQAWDTYFGDSKKIETTLPKSLFNRILRNQELAGLVTHMEMMGDEEDLIDQQKPRWRDSIGPYLKKIIETDRQRYQRRSGLLFLKEMARQSNKVADLLTQSEVIRFEVVDAQRVDYAYKAQNVDVSNTTDEVNLDFATAVDFIYWPFNGEFWKDELGYYKFTEQGSCN